MNAIKHDSAEQQRQGKNRPTPSDNTISMVESVFAEYSGFKKSEMLRRKIKRVVEGKADNEILAWVNEMLGSRGESELSALSEDLTNNETFFFRDIIQFECLGQHILPALIKQKMRSNDRVIRLWSAACSTGEEAYSLAIVAVEYMIKQNMAKITDSGRLLFNDGWNIKVYGTDISGQVIKIARNATYSNAGLSAFRGFPPQYYRYFDRQERCKDRLYAGEYETFKVKESICNLVYFDRHNLLKNELPLFLNNMDVVFCRNMLIYIESAAQKKIQNKFCQAMAARAYLLLSAVDTMHHEKLFEEVRMGNNLVYQRRG